MSYYLPHNLYPSQLQLHLLLMLSSHRPILPPVLVDLAPLDSTSGSSPASSPRPQTRAWWLGHRSILLASRHLPCPPSLPRSQQILVMAVMMWQRIPRGRRCLGRLRAVECSRACDHRSRSFSSMTSSAGEVGSRSGSERSASGAAAITVHFLHVPARFSPCCV